MMEGQNGSTFCPKKGKPPYSVETPYGYRLDLDFLKYVDDIEKGNTIKRVHIHRRSKGPRASTLPRHLNAPGCGYRSTPWGSTGALGSSSRLSEAHHRGYTSWANGHMNPFSQSGLKTLTEMEARIKEFDEQPLGEHVRPQLLRASSLPLTVLLRQGSESSDDPGSLQSSRDQLGGRNISCEDVFYSADSSPSQDCSVLLRRLKEALERVGELEKEVRVIPELKMQIYILQEEKERLRLGLKPHTTTPSLNGTTDRHTSSHYGTVDLKRARHESQTTLPRKHSVHEEDSYPSHEWRTSTDLDELLTVTSLQAKVAALEQKLHETDLELQRALVLLKESRNKDVEIEYLARTPGLWVQAERVVIDQDGAEAVVRPTEPCDRLSNPDTVFTSKEVTTNRRGSQQDPVADSPKKRPVFVGAVSDEGADAAMVVGHIKKVKMLLDEQWECLCADSESGEEGKPRNQPDPKVHRLQQEMMGLLDILFSYYNQHEHTDDGMAQPGDGCARSSKSLHSGGVNDGGNVVGHYCVNQSEESESSVSPGVMAAAQVDANPEKRWEEGEKQTSPDGQMISGGAGSERTDGGAASEGAEAPENTAKMKSQASGEQMEDSSDSESTTRGRETVSSDFLAACLFLKDHMENMDNPNNDMRKALVVLFQHWFSMAAEETSVASELSVYLREVRKATPSLLAFLVNLADDNGNTVLHYSVSHCNYSIVGLLLDTGVCDVNLQNNAGYTAIMLAALTAPDGPGGMEVVRRLMEMGNIHIRSKQTGQTALHLAVRHGRVVMVRLLLSYGADANIQDNQGTTALMFASERGHTHVARLLLERSQCDLTLTDKRGRTALSIAMQGSHTDTAALLQAHAKARAS